MTSFLIFLLYLFSSCFAQWNPTTQCYTPLATTIFEFSNFSQPTPFLSLNHGGYSSSPFTGQTNLRLTNGLAPGSRAYGQAYTTSKVSFANQDFSFSTVFQFRIVNNVGSLADPHGGPLGADGFAFIIQDNSNNPSNGDLKMGHQFLGKCIAFEFDIFGDVGIDPSDNGNHIGMNEGGDLRSKSDRTIDTSSKGYLNNGNVWTAWIEYRASGTNTQIRLSTTSNRPSSADIQYGGWNLVNVIGGTREAFVGFGGSVNNQAASNFEIINWKFRNEYYPYDACSAGQIWTGSSCFTCTGGVEGNCCKQCAAGTFSSSSNCIDCPANTFSLGGSSTCANCSCVNGSCEKKNGTCYCNEGSTGATCATCLPGYFGATCSKCPSCVNGKCNDGANGNGACSCSLGFSGDLCQDCSSGYFGPTCSKCPSCVNGTCNEGKNGNGLCDCTTNYNGTLCDRCVYNKQGSDCSLCATGFGGDLCEACPSFCNLCTPSQCTQCQAGKKLFNGTCLDSCPNGYYPNPSSTCQECSVFCKTCDGPTSSECLSCEDHRTLSGKNCVCDATTFEYPTNSAEFLQGLCWSCSETCNPGKCINSPVNCTECNPIYQDLGNGLCGVLDCSDTCSNAQCDVNNSEKCLICKESYTMTDMVAGKCEFVVCLENCGSCISNTTCDSCQNGFQLSNSNTECLRICSEGCVLGECDANQECSTCQENFILENSTCYRNCSGCKLGFCNQNFQCTECQDQTNYYLENGKCFPIIECHPNCTSSGCSLNGTCSQCQLGYLLQASSCVLNTNCPNCTTEKCYEGNICQECIPGNYLKDGKCNLIIECAAPCLNCTLDGNCLLCPFGYLTQNSSCIPNTRCQSCQPLSCSIDDKCFNCIEGYHNNSNGACLQNIPCSNKCFNSTYCTFDGKCSKCVDGYELDSSGKCKLIEACGPSCEFEKCNLDYVCSQCITGSYLSGGNCLRIRECNDDCVREFCYLNGTCGRCKEGFYLASTTSCLPITACIQNCDETQCSLNGTCLACAPGFFFNEEGACQKCSQNCIKCTSSTSCLTCSEGTSGENCEAAESKNEGMIIGIAVGVVFLFLCCAAFIIFILVKRSRKTTHKDHLALIDLRNSANIPTPEITQVTNKNYSERAKSGQIDATMLNTTLEISLPGFLQMNFNEQLRVEEKFGQGGAGILHKGTLLDPRLVEKYGTKDVVIKFVTKIPSLSKNDNEELFKREVAIMWSLSFSPNVISLIGFCCGEANDILSTTPCIVTKMYNMDLSQLIHKSSQVLLTEEKCSILRDIASGMASIHEMNIAHRDLKTSNILIEKKGNQIKAVVCDFGLAVAASDSVAVREDKPVLVQGLSPKFSPPETFARIRVKNLEINITNEKKSDVYAFAVIVWEILTEKVPWEGHESEEIEMKVREGLRPSPLPEGKDPRIIALCQIMTKAWSQSPLERPSFQDIKIKIDSIL